jgi:hypothetical protein
MNKKEYKFFAPNEIAIGLFDFNSNISGFPTCRYMDKGWLKTSTFKRLTKGYMPTQMKDPELQLKKTLYNKVLTLNNDPVEGFYITGLTGNIYGYLTHDYKYSYGDVIITDPRGFQVGIAVKDFIKILASSNISNGKLVGKYFYVWSTDEQHYFTLIKEGTAEFENAIGCRKNFESLERPKDKSVKKKELIIGCAYTAKKVLTGDWIYAGIYPTYSGKCHIAAFDNNKYDIPAAIENEKKWSSTGYYTQFKTSINKMIFFPDKVDYKYPWVARSDISGIFKNKTKLPSYFNLIDLSSKNVSPTLESINNAISVSPAFQRIDFKRFKYENKWEPLDFEVFNYIFSLNNNIKITQFPFDKSYNLIIKSNNTHSTYNNCWIKLGIDRGWSAKNDITEWFVWNLSEIKRLKINNYSLNLFSYKNKYTLSHNDMYQLIKPLVPIMYFENGYKVPQQIALKFVPKEIRTLVDY